VNRFYTCIVIFATVGLSSCAGIGPNTIPRDRFDYNAAISDSWKEQTLLNIVKLRYADMPLFVEVASVVSGYSLESSVNIAGADTSADAGSLTTGSVGGAARFTDRPTITYAPITGSKFNKSFMVPIPPHAVMFLVQSGWPIDLVFPLAIESVNGLRSESASGVDRRDGDPGYYRVLELFDQLRRSGGTGMQIQRDDESGDTSVLIIHRSALSNEEQVSLEDLATVLGLRQGQDSYTVKYGFLPGGDTEIALITRSMLQIIIMLATQVDVPAEHIASGEAIASSYDGSRSGERRLVDIRSSVEVPEDAFVSVRYNDYWYWIPKSDFASKRMFTFVMILFSLTESGNQAGLPLVTIPAN
jgi:hypothetical protein